MSGEQIAAVGSLGWDLVKNGKGVTGAQSKFVSAMPKDLKIGDFEGGKRVTRDYVYEAPCRAGIGVRANIRVQFYSNVSLSKEKLKSAKLKSCIMVHNLSAWCTDVEASWNWTINVSASVAGQPFNDGKADAVEAGIPIMLTASHQDWVKSYGRTKKLIAFADGRLREG